MNAMDTSPVTHGELREALTQTEQRLTDRRHGSGCGPGARQTLLDVLRRAHVRARISVETYTYETQLALVGGGRGFGVTIDCIQ